MENIQFYIEIFVLAVAFVAIIYPLRNAYLLKDTNRIGKAAAFNYKCEAVGMAVTAVFAALALSHVLVDVHWIIQACMRLVILGGTIWGSYVLRKAILSSSE